MRIRLSHTVLEATFGHFRRCGKGQRECQVLWVGPWADTNSIAEVVHPHHSASPVGFRLADDWLTSFWLELADKNYGVRVQVHTHPGAAFHSSTDDAFPIVSTPGFLSLVIPNFGLGRAGFSEAFLAHRAASGIWCEVPVAEYLEVVP